MVEVYTMLTSVEDNKRIARRVPEDIATQRNMDLLEEVYAPDAVENGIFGEEPVRGIEEVRARLESVFEAFPDFSATVEEIIAEKDTVAMRVTLRGTHEGVFMGMEPTGESFEVQNMVFTHVEDGKITERWVLPDALGMFQQLGVVSPPGA